MDFFTVLLGLSVLEECINEHLENERRENEDDNDCPRCGQNHIRYKEDHECPRCGRFHRADYY